MVTEVPHATLGATPTLGHPVKFSLTPAEVKRGAPLFGEHSREVLREHDFSDQEIDDLITEGAVVAA